MKILYVYDKLPKTYQEYLNILLHEIKKRTPIKILAYSSETGADYNISSSRLKRNFYTFVSKLGVIFKPNVGINIMRQYDIIHIQHSYLFVHLTSFFRNTTRKPKIVITLRGADTYLKPWIYEKWELFYKKQSQYIDAFVTVSQHQKAYLQRWGVDEDKIHVIPVSFGNKTPALPKQLSGKTIKIISAHRMCWEKNINGNLRTILFLKEAGYNVQYDIFGDGPDKAQVSYLIDKYGLGKDVNFYGKIENAAYKRRLTDYDFFLQLSLSEAFGASVIEAQSMGLPAIISNTDGLPETILDGVTGYCVDANSSRDAANCIIDLYKDKEKFYSFSKEAIKHSNANFSSDIEAEKLMQLYNSLIHKN
ncbi:glycosyltransferase involved in cell wall biosynthesis [Winogradskyella wandonensis]|uniref:Glycosyltransferase involved in cell wall biosynthesis n=1 Tax=Winogradskyella wandonensis TaxID=1442586 RepID=A0A4V2PU30_9FLAO|nr:glycosyltransferase family 4 protein [Winogradskyella wandonensis]TCK68821.1 glycosyltransferase involved in cell wall biosynthesis [Winogradskyella wandonensis]